MGEEEATMRGKLIEAMARALCEAVMRLLNPRESDAEIGARVHAAWRLHAAHAEQALDAALHMLETPSKEMWQAGSDELAETALDNHAFSIQAQKTFRAMLATLRSPKI